MHRTLIHICCVLLRRAKLNLPEAGHHAGSNTCCDNGLNRFGVSCMMHMMHMMLSLMVH